jgi:hypothetical protein
LCIQQCLTDFLLHWTTHNGSWKCALKKCWKCAHWNCYVCKIRVNARVLEASLLETWNNIAKMSLDCFLASA